MTTDHEPNAEWGSIENRGGFVSNMPGQYFLENISTSTLLARTTISAIYQTSEKDYVASGMRSPYYWKMEWRCRVARKGKILSNLYVALDELCFMNNAPRRRSKKEKCFTEEEIDNHGKIPGYVSMKNSVKDQIKYSMAKMTVPESFFMIQDFLLKYLGATVAVILIIEPFFSGHLSKIVPIPSVSLNYFSYKFSLNLRTGTHSIVKYFGGQVPSSSSFNQPLGNAFDEAVPSSLSGFSSSQLY
ncbi:hypothetical protein AHAS_Ahas13G0298800 [Arachis hypogaea]